MESRFPAGLYVAVVFLLGYAAAAGQPSTAPNKRATSVLYATDYGEALPATDDTVKLWWCNATHKISRRRVAPDRPGKAIRMAAAKNEFEAAQLVVRPEKLMTGLTASISDLRGLRGATIPASNIQLLRVRYVSVKVPTDAVGVADDWPDPLPPFDHPIDVPAGMNQPIWILVHVPEATAAGDYEGTLRFAATGWAAAVPLKLHVWDFALPKTPYTQSALRLSMGMAYEYHGVASQEDRRALFEKYMQSFADHRISPYDPTPFDPIEIRFIADADPPRAELSFERFDAAMQRAIDQWHITSFKLNIPGMGSGTFEFQKKGVIKNHEAGTAAYEAMFSSAVKQIEEHLRQKGWLDKAYIYWFDEPQPRDYDFVRDGMDRLKKYAPGLRRMLTEEPIEPLFGAVDLWCPITFNYDHAAAEKRREKSEQFWWYVCTGPKEPYCGLFIDHAATDLRVWLWQTWQRKIAGILVWETLWWTSRQAFPDSMQNPYEDPMSYASSYSQPPGTKQHWGNGDGRFLYPPESAAGVSKTPVLDGPVSSIRWEMLRDGIEDLDYLHILAAAIRMKASDASEDVLKQAKALLEVPSKITRGMKEFTLDPSPIYERRTAVAEMIERLGGPSGK